MDFLSKYLHYNNITDTFNILPVHMTELQEYITSVLFQLMLVTELLQGKIIISNC